MEHSQPSGTFARATSVGMVVGNGPSTPSRIGDLRAEVDGNWVSFEWTAPGANLDYGKGEYFRCMFWRSIFTFRFF